MVANRWTASMSRCFMDTDGSTSRYLTRLGQADPFARGFANSPWTGGHRQQGSTRRAPALSLAIAGTAGSLSRPEATFVTRLRPMRLPAQAARQLPDQSNLPPLMIRAFGAHCQNRTGASHSSFMLLYLVCDGVPTAELRFGALGAGFFGPFLRRIYGCTSASD
jgi:hypothetical protein